MTQSKASGQASESGAGAGPRTFAKLPLSGSQSAPPGPSNKWSTDADSRGGGSIAEPRPVGLNFLTWKRVRRTRQGSAGV